MTEETNDTIPPTHHQSMLEQFEAFAAGSLKDLEEVVIKGLIPAENDVLIRLAAQIIQLAKLHDSEALNKVAELVNAHQ